MERLRRYEEEEPAAPPLPEVRRGSDAPSEAPVGPATVQVIWGPMVEPMAVGRMTVGEVRALLQRAYNIPAHAATLVDGRRVTAQHRLTAGETLEFVRMAGEKGAGQSNKE